MWMTKKQYSIPHNYFSLLSKIHNCFQVVWNIKRTMWEMMKIENSSSMTGRWKEKKSQDIKT